MKSQISGKQREIRMLQLTSEEVSTLPADTNVYEGVGKMFVSPSSSITPSPSLSLLRVTLHFICLGGHRI